MGSSRWASSHPPNLADLRDWVVELRSEIESVLSRSRIVQVHRESNTETVRDTWHQEDSWWSSKSWGSSSDSGRWSMHSDHRWQDGWVWTPSWHGKSWDDAKSGGMHWQWRRWAS